MRDHAVADDPSELAFGFEHAGGGPAERHLAPDCRRLTLREVRRTHPETPVCRHCGTLPPPEAVVERNRSLLAGTWPLLAGVRDDLCLPCARKGDTIALSDAPPALDERRS